MTDVQSSTSRQQRPTATAASGVGGAFGLMSFIGALVYFWGSAEPGFLDHVVAIIKALVWPGFVVYGVLRALFG